MTITNIQTPANSSFTFTQWIDKTNEIIDAVNLSQPGSFVQKSGDFMNGTLTANGSNGIAFASAGGSFSRPITFLSTNLPFNDNGGTTVAFLSETGSFNFIGNLNFIQTSASAYSWNFTPNYSNHTLTLKRAGNDNLMVFSNNQINLVKNTLFTGNATVSGNVIISGQTTINNTSVNQGKIFWNQSDDSMYIQRYDADGSSVQGEIKLANTLISTSVSLSVTGNITASGNVTANSDRRLKENIRKIENALDKIEQINGVYFNKIGEDSTNMGFIAQDLETVIPEVVHQGTEYKSVAYGNISALLVEGIKELKSQLDELKQQIEDMKK